MWHVKYVLENKHTRSYNASHYLFIIGYFPVYCTLTAAVKCFISCIFDRDSKKCVYVVTIMEEGIHSEAGRIHTDM